MREPCLFDGCDRAARPRYAYCRGHLEQKWRGKTLAPLDERWSLVTRKKTSRFEWLALAFKRYWNAEDDAEFQRAKALAQKHLAAYSKASRNGRVK